MFCERPWQSIAHIILSFVLICPASAYDQSMCPPTTPTGQAPGLLGPCDANMMCSTEAGPSDCVNSLCLCQTGYCSHYTPVNSRSPIKFEATGGHYCIARVPGKTCRKPTDCMSAGPGTTLCIESFCMCLYGYRYDETTMKCMNGWYPPPMMATWPPVPMVALAEQDQETLAVAFNSARVSAFVVAGVAVSIGSVMLARRRFCALLKEDHEYEQLQSDAEIHVTQ